MMGRNVCFLAAAVFSFSFHTRVLSPFLPVRSPFFSFFISLFYAQASHTSLPHLHRNHTCSSLKYHWPPFSRALCVFPCVFPLSFFFFFSSQAAVTTTMSLSQWQPQCDGHNHDH
ncbi:hypothetical protein F5148DRAFT_1208562, partial [Russula earlei]